MDSLVILQSSPTFREMCIQYFAESQSITHLNAIGVKRGEEDELVLPVVSGVPHNVVQGDPAQDC